MDNMIDNAASRASKQAQNIAIFAAAPDAGFCKSTTLEALFACGRTTVWRHIKGGVIPQPVCMGGKSRLWNVGQIRAALAALANPEISHTK
jgi:predicted DNA-binding transcriptional regulator AlpA